MNTLKKSLVVVLVLALGLSILSFADTSTIGKGEQGKFQGGPGVIGKGEMKKRIGEVLKEKGDAGYYLKYAQEFYAEMLTLNTDHLAIHEEIAVAKEEIQSNKEDRKMLTKEFVLALREQYAEAIQNGEMTREELKAEFQVAVQTEYGVPLGGEYKEALESLRLKLKTNKEAREALRCDMRAAHKVGNEEEIHDLLVKLAELRYEHYELDQEHLAILLDLIG